MGTRGLTVMVRDGNTVVAQYGQWDHYPSGQGLTALAFCRDVLATEDGRAAFADKLARCRFISKEEYLQRQREALGGPEEMAGFLNMEEVRKIDAALPYITPEAFDELDEDTQIALAKWYGSKILGLIMEAPGEVLLFDQSDFADSLMCEWAYVVDLDSKTLEVYEGFNKSGKAEGRFSSLPARVGYAPVTLRKSYSLDSLPDEDSFLEDLKESGDE